MLAVTGELACFSVKARVYTNRRLAQTLFQAVLGGDAFDGPVDGGECDYG